FLFLTPPPSTLFPYTTLFRSCFATDSAVAAAIQNRFAMRIGIGRADEQRCLATVFARHIRQNLVEWRAVIDTLQLSVVVVRGRVDRKSTRLNSSHVKISYAVF